MVIYRYSTIGQGQDYESPQAWAQATSGINLISTDEVYVGLITTNQEWNDLYISNNTGYVDNEHYRHLMSINDGFFNYENKSGSKIHGISGEESYFRLGPGIGIPRYNQTGVAINISGRRLILNSLTIYDAGPNSIGINLIDNYGESIIINSLAYGNFSSGIGYKTDNSGSYLINCTFYSTGDSVGSTGFSAINVVSLGEVQNSARIITDFQKRCASTYSGSNASEYSGIDPYFEFVNTYKNRENFSPLDSNSLLAISGFILDNLIDNNGYLDVLPSTFSGIYTIYSGSSEIESLLSNDLLNNRRFDYPTMCIGAIEPKLSSITTTRLSSDIRWYQSIFNPDSISGKVGGNINLNKSISSGYIDVFPTIYSYANNWNYVSEYERLPFLYVKSGDNVDFAYLANRENDEKIVLRGWNYISIKTGDYLGVPIQWNNLLVEENDFNYINNVFSNLRDNGYNCVRFFIDPGNYGVTGTIGSSILGTGLDSNYLDKLATFISGAAEHKLYTVLFADTVPFNQYYFIDLIQPSSLSINADIGVVNQAVLFTGYMNSKKQYLSDISNELKTRLGDSVNYIIWNITNEAYLTNEQPPFRFSDQATGLIIKNGVYPNPNHISGWWDMSIPSEVTDMTVYTTNYIFSEYVNVIKTTITGALVGANNAPWKVLQKINATGWADMQDIHETKDHWLVARHYTGAGFDLLGLNIYPNIYLKPVGDSLVFNRRFDSFSEGMLGSELELIDYRNTVLWCPEYGFSSAPFMPGWDNSYIEYIKKTNIITSSTFDNYIYFNLSGNDLQTLSPYKFYSIYDTDVSGELNYLLSPNTYHNFHYLDNTGIYCYRKVYAKNHNDSIYNTRVYISDEEYLDSVGIALVKNYDDYSYDSYRIPPNYSIDDFYFPRTYENGLNIGTLNSGDSVGIWIRVDVEGYKKDPFAGFNLIIEGTKYV